MSNDDMELDPDEIESMADSEYADLSPEDAFKMVMINKVRKKRIHVELRDSSGDIVPLHDIVKELLNYINTKLKDEDENQFTAQIMPLMSQAVVSGLGRLIGIPQTAFFLTDQTTKLSIIHMMCVAFLMLKFVQQKGLSIETFETDVSDEEIEGVQRKSQANSIAVLGALAGQDPKSILEELRNQGKITDQDIRDLLSDNGETYESKPGKKSGSN